jgi:hypothetical protein
MGGVKMKKFTCFMAMVMCLTISTTVFAIGPIDWTMDKLGYRPQSNIEELQSKISALEKKAVGLEYMNKSFEKMVNTYQFWVIVAAFIIGLLILASLRNIFEVLRDAKEKIKRPKKGCCVPTEQVTPIAPAPQTDFPM